MLGGADKFRTSWFAVEAFLMTTKNGSVCSAEFVIDFSVSVHIGNNLWGSTVFNPGLKEDAFPPKHFLNFPY